MTKLSEDNKVIISREEYVTLMDKLMETDDDEANLKWYEKERERYA